jgi:hypothetical protein
MVTKRQIMDAVIESRGGSDVTVDNVTVSATKAGNGFAYVAVVGDEVIEGSNAETFVSDVVKFLKLEGGEEIKVVENVPVVEVGKPVIAPVATVDETVVEEKRVQVRVTKHETAMLDKVANVSKVVGVSLGIVRSVNKRVARALFNLTVNGKVSVPDLTFEEMNAALDTLVAVNQVQLAKAA